MAKAKVVKPRHKDGDSKLFAFLAVLLSIIGFLLVFLAKRDDRYAMYYAKQSLVIFIVWIPVAVIFMVPLIGKLIWLVWFVLWIIAIVNSLSGKMKPTPLIGGLADKFDL